MKRRSFIQAMAAGVCAFCTDPKEIIRPILKVIQSATGIVNIPISQLHCPGHRHHNLDAIRTIEGSIRNQGLLLPIIVTLGCNCYEVVDGYQRLHSYQRLGNRSIECLIVNRQKVKLGRSA